MGIWKIKQTKAGRKLCRGILRQIPTETIVDFLHDPCKEYRAWLQKLEQKREEGLSDACISWIKAWGNGGGDYSTEACIAEALTENPSDQAAEVARTIYESVAEYSKTSFEASVLAMDIVNMCLQEYKDTGQE